MPDAMQYYYREGFTYDYFLVVEPYNKGRLATALSSLPSISNEGQLAIHQVGHWTPNSRVS